MKEVLATPEDNFRQVWHDGDMRGKSFESCRGGMYRRPETHEIEDGSVLSLWECTSCGATVFIGLDRTRRIVRRASPAPVSDDVEPCAECGAEKTDTKMGPKCLICDNIPPEWLVASTTNDLLTPDDSVVGALGHVIVGQADGLSWVSIGMYPRRPTEDLAWLCDGLNALNDGITYTVERVGRVADARYTLTEVADMIEAETDAPNGPPGPARIAQWLRTLDSGGDE